MKAVLRIILALLLLCNSAQAMVPYQLPEPDVLYAPFHTNLYYYSLGARGTATFTRGSARVFEDWEGNYVRTTNTNEATFKARRVANLLAADSSEDFSVASWTKFGAATVTGTNAINFPDNYGGVSQAIYVKNTGQVFRWAVTLSGSGTTSVVLYNTATGYTTTAIGSKAVTLSATPKRFSVVGTSIYAGGGILAYIIRNGNTATQVTATNAMLEEVTGQSNGNPSEYTSTHQYYGGQTVKGVQYLDYENGNTVDANGVVTEAQGAAIPAADLHGILYDGTATNKIAGAHNAVGPDMLSTTNIYANYDFTSEWTAANATINDSNTFTAMIDNGSIRLTAGGCTTGKRYRLVVAGTVSAGTFIVADATTGTVLLSGFGTVDFTAESATGPRFKASIAGAVVDITTLTMYEIGAAKLAGTFWSGGGTGAKNTAAATAAIPGQTHGGTGSTTITNVSAVITSTNKYKRLTPATKWYVTTASGGDATVDLTGALSAAAHTLSLVAYGATDSDVLTLGTNTVAGTPQTVTTAPVLYSQTLTANASDTMRLTVADGDTITWCLMQAETGTVPTSRIIVEGAAASRSRDAETEPIADGTDFRQREWTLQETITFPFASTSIPNSGSFAIRSTTTSATSALYIDRSAGGQLQMNSTDGTNTVTTNMTEWNAGDQIIFKVTASTAKNKMNNYNSVDGWGTAEAYDGAMAIGTSWQTGYNSAYPFARKEPQVLGTFDIGGM